MLDILKPVVSLMVKSQAVNVPPWKIISWYSQSNANLLKCEDNLKEIEAGAKRSKDLFPKLSKHWEELTPGTIDNDDEPDPGTFQVF